MCSNGTCARFNSKLVRLEVDYTLSQLREFAREFQFQTGSIRRLMMKAIIVTNTSFNSKLVRLEAKLKNLTWRRLSRFDSKLVRLEESTLAFCADIAHVQFQFQTGSIRSSQNTDYFGCADLFQFQTGSIRRQKQRNLWKVSILCFNSKLVQLEGTEGGTNLLDSGMFQFQTGSIRSTKRCQLWLNVRTFQFQTGSIKSG